MHRPLLLALTFCLGGAALAAPPVTMTAQEGRSSAVGLYASIFYIGGSAGAFLTGLAWNAAGWNGCVVLIAAMLVVMAVVVAVAWD